jgi:hypothetical protein
MTKTLNLDNYSNYLAWFALVNSPLEGLRLSDLEKLEQAKKLFVCDRFEGERAVELPNELLPLMRAAWDNFPLGKVARTDDLPGAVARVSEQLKG